MDYLKKFLVLALTALLLAFFPARVYGENTGSLVYYKNEEMITERVYFSDEASDEKKAFILLKVLLKNKCDNVPKSIDVNFVFLDEGGLFVELSSQINNTIEADRGRLMEQITKTACSLNGVDSIIIFTEDLKQ